MFNQKRDKFRGATLLTSTTEVIEAAKHYFDENSQQGLVQRERHLVAQGSQHGIEDPGSIELNLHPVAVSDP